MSTTMFVEATSADPFVRDLCRRAVRLLNDPSLDRQQRESHVRRLQSSLREHQAKQLATVSREAVKKRAKEAGSHSRGSPLIADPSQVKARRKDITLREPEFANEVASESGRCEGEKVVAATLSTGQAQADDKPKSGRNRPVLRLRST